MPDPKEDYDYLYQVGENSYREPWNMRSLFGLSNPRALTSQEEVTVTPSMPDENAQYPPNMDEIYLGTKTLPPTGTYTPNRTQTPTVNPELQPAWNDVVKRYPFAQNLVQNVDTKLYPRQTSKGIVPDDSIYGSQSGNSVFINADLPFDKPAQVPRTLTHELTHAAQYKQFPDDKRNDAHYGMRLPYHYRPGEELAREVSTQAQSKVDKEILDDAQARMVADWKAGKGPKPWFMYDDVIARRKAREAADK